MRVTEPVHRVSQVEKTSAVRFRKCKYTGGSL